MLRMKPLRELESAVSSPQSSVYHVWSLMLSLNSAGWSYSGTKAPFPDSSVLPGSSFSRPAVPAAMHICWLSIAGNVDLPQTWFSTHAVEGRALPCSSTCLCSFPHVCVLTQAHLISLLLGSPNLAQLSSIDKYTNLNKHLQPGGIPTHTNLITITETNSQTGTKFS